MSFGNEREFIDYLHGKEMITMEPIRAVAADFAKRIKKEEGKTMKCPLLLISAAQQISLAGEAHADCIKEECAWWDVNAGGCSVYLINRSLQGLFDILVDIKEKMPHELQFRKV